MRLDPQLPTHMVKTYAVDAPLPSHWRPASCAEVDCGAHRNGWITTIPENPDAAIAAFLASLEVEKVEPEGHVANLMRLKDRDVARAYYIRHLSGREFTEHVDESGITVFDFPPGQDCFDQHRMRIDKPEIFVVRGGDFRGNPMRDTRIHERAEDWVEDFSEHQDELATRIERG